MTTPKRPSGAPTTPKAASGSTPAADALSGLPPMPKTKPARPRKTPGTTAGGASDGGPPAVTKKELFTRVKARTGKIKGREVRDVMDVLLDEIGLALVAGETLKVPALGTLKVQRQKSQAGADVVVCKLNRKKPGARPKEPLAEPAEGS